MEMPKNEPHPAKQTSFEQLPFYHHKFEAVKYRHEDQARLSVILAQMDLQIFSGFLTIQIALGGFLMERGLQNFYAKSGLLLIDIGLAMVCYLLLRHNTLRRKEVVKTIINCNEALGLSQKGAILESKSINADTYPRLKFPWYLIGVVLTIIGVAIILFFGQSIKNT